MGIIEEAQAGRITERMEKVAAREGVTPEHVRKGVAEGRVVIPESPYRETVPVGIGEGLGTKVNASIGTSADVSDLEMELEKVRAAEDAGADTLMELSTGGALLDIRREVCGATDLSVGSVPLYQTFVEAAREHGTIVDMDEDDLFRDVEEQARLGTNFMAIHTGINLETVERLERQGRHGGLVSRGGAFLTTWMLHHGRENPLYGELDYLCEILKEHEVTLSMGNGMRAGAVHDATDRAQVQELITNAELADRAHGMGVQTIVEGPGHVPLDEVETNVKLMKSLTGDKPFYMLGPIVTDVAPGYDEVVAAIGASLSSAHGADFICYVTPAEHLALPSPEDVHRGVTSARIAAHTGDMVKLGRQERDLEMAEARRTLDWDRQHEVAIDTDRAARLREERTPEDERTCTMCSEHCALKLVSNRFGPGD